jgi:hypothetical protein
MNTAYNTKTNHYPRPYFFNDIVLPVELSGFGRSLLWILSSNLSGTLCRSKSTNLNTRNRYNRQVLKKTNAAKSGFADNTLKLRISTEIAFH